MSQTWTEDNEWTEDDDEFSEFSEFPTIAALSAEEERIEAQLAELGPSVDRGDETAVRQYLALNGRQLAIFNERLRRRRSEPSPVVAPMPALTFTSPTTATTNPLEAEAARLRAVAEDAEMQIRNTALPTEVRNRALEDRAVALHRANALDREAPFHGKTEEQLTEALEAAKIAAEEAVEVRETLKGKRRAELRRAKAERDLQAAREKVGAIEAEMGRRHERTALAEYVRARSRQKAHRELLDERRREAFRIADDAARQYGQNHWRTVKALGEAHEVSVSDDEVVARAAALETEMRNKSDRDLRQMLTRGFVLREQPAYEPIRQRR